MPAVLHECLRESATQVPEAAWQTSSGQFGKPLIRHVAFASTSNFPSAQIMMRKVDGWQTLTTKSIAQPIDLAA
jgi:hypothetical protein